MAFRDDRSYAWTIAVSPLAGGAVAALQAAGGLPAWTSLVTIAAVIVLIALDWRMLDQRGVGTEVFSPIGYLIPPLYLIQRTKYVGSPAAIPIAWFACLGAAVLAAVAVSL